MDKDLEAPCAGCVGYSNYVKGDLYMTSHASRPLKEAIDDWFKDDKDTDVWSEDFCQNRVVGLTQEDYDSVTKPRHYMLFDDDAVIAYEGKGIEVRDVIEKLVNKIPPVSRDYGGLFVADYVQMMQYFMRFMVKNGLEDLKKGRWFLDKVIEAYESDV
jgi:hypothetical protein